MARVVQQSVLGVRDITPNFYNLMTDGTMWRFCAGVWTQAPAIPGSRVVNCITVIPGDTVIAACTDGTIWSAQVTTPFTWSQVATTPP